MFLPQARFEANADLFAARKKFYESSLDYHTELNCFQHKKKFAILEPILTFMHAQVSCSDPQKIFFSVCLNISTFAANEHKGHHFVTYQVSIGNEAVKFLLTSLLQMAYFKVGHEILSRELGNLLTDLNTEVQR